MEELRASPRVTKGAALAVSIGVGLRTIERDIADLVAAGIPVGRVRGRYGGYRLDATATPQSVSFTLAEASAVAVALASVGPYSSACNQSALEKALNALAPTE